MSATPTRKVKRKSVVGAQPAKGGLKAGMCLALVAKG